MSAFPVVDRGTADPSASLGMTNRKGQWFKERGCQTETLKAKPRLLEGLISRGMLKLRPASSLRPHSPFLRYSEVGKKR
jgi:hypothetical protein